ncbi:hypothetical protein [Luteolibacter luteus]|uniref:Uncharacterized protein n=1 Tax=Luteolibacter luteus TaxID=2728835 RepID=A0A858RCB8_9BACT|nr:hypothetical protein [Luteolibacter luteus]QJE94291.1 hypothetical protein HHL09_00310 [Luteolibacter luteus]
MSTPSSMPAAPAQKPHTQSGILEIDYGILSSRSAKAFQASVIALLVLGVAAATRLIVTKPDFVLPFLIIAAPALAALYLWTSTRNHGLPLLPIFILQQALVYGLPLMIDHPGLKFVKLEVIQTSALGVGLFILCCLGGWFLGKSSVSARPSRYDLIVSSGKQALDRCLGISLSLLTICLCFHLSVRTGFIYEILPGIERFYSVMRTFANASGALGALFGGLAIGSKPSVARAWIFWILFASIFLLSVADVLLSGAAGLVLSTAIGLTLGKQKAPLKFLLMTFAVVGFLNQGKFTLREKYWSDDSNTTRMTLTELPSLYMEWADASLAAFLGDKVSSGLAKDSDKEGDGQSFLERVNNLQNMTYVVECFKERGAKPMMGETYALIPPLFVPRILWKDKPRTHEGQVRLNLHFGRQSTVEQTEKTYVAWGLLPEAVGNFGPTGGPVILGLALGTAMGWLETVSRRKRVFSVEGMALAGALLLTATSYEQVASVFLTALFQFVMAAVVGGSLLRMWAGEGGGSRAKKAGSQSFRRIAP